MGAHYLEKDVSQCFGILHLHLQQRGKESRFVPACPMSWIQGVVAQFADID
ncbi:MAG: hypothetical protein HYW07_03685 [Candidatus Latescibacteria bacterium]|nr:hypothetical protein [Candidatus Latescibacterota bacterium]